MNKYINEFKKQQQIKLRKMHKQSPKEYWKYLNSLKRNKSHSNTPPLDSFLEFLSISTLTKRIKIMPP